MSRDLYQLLGVEPSATSNEIRSAYRKLARALHPDVSPDERSAERFKEVSRAFSVLSDPSKRKLYDEFGERSLRRDFDPQKARRRRDGRPTVKAEDLFCRKNRPARSGGAKGSQDVEMDLEIELGTAIKGGALKLRAPAGGVITVHVPPGVSEGQRLRLVGKGQPARRGARAGDLFLSISIRPDRFFRRAGDALVLTLPISLGEACRGASIRIPSPHGDLRVTVPPGTRGGERLRIEGKGLVRDAGGFGDLLVDLSIRLPSRVDERLLRQMSSEYGDQLRAELKL